MITDRTVVPAPATTIPPMRAFFELEAAD